MSDQVLAERMAASETRVFKAVFPSNTNHYGTLFSGHAMQLMDEVAFIAATRFSRKRLLTVSSDSINFTQPIAAGTIIELVARVTHVGRTSLKVTVDVFVERMYEERREQAIEGAFSFIAVDEDARPVPVLDG